MKLNWSSVIADWKKVSPYSKTKEKDPVLAALEAEVVLFKNYDPEYFVDGVTGNNSAGDFSRFTNGIPAFRKALDTAISKKKDWPPAATKFLINLNRIMVAEEKFWKSAPTTAALPPLPEKDLRKHWNDRKTLAIKNATGGGNVKFPINFDKNLGPLLDKFEQAKTQPDRKKFGVQANQVILQYRLEVSKHKDLVDASKTVLVKELDRLQAVVLPSTK